MGVITAVKGFGRNCKMKLIKHSPELCLIFGIAGVVGGTVLACNATLKVKDKIDTRDEKINAIKDKYTKTLEVDENGETTVSVYDNKECKNEITKVHVMTALDIAKDYAPAVISTGVGIGLLCGGHHTLNKRYLAMTAAYTGLQKTFNDYRSNVRIRFGEDIDKELLYGVTNVVVTNPETNEEQTLPCTDISQYDVNENDTRVLFCETSPFWTKDPEENLNLIELTIFNMNNKLEKRGKENGKHAVLFLNEVLDAFGLPRTSAGQYLGWRYDPEVTHKIDAGIYNAAHTMDKGAIRFLDGVEPCIWMNFNVDGNVLQYV